MRTRINCGRKWSVSSLHTLMKDRTSTPKLSKLTATSASSSGRWVRSLLLNTYGRSPTRKRWTFFYSWSTPSMTLIASGYSWINDLMISLHCSNRRMTCIKRSRKLSKRRMSMLLSSTKITRMTKVSSRKRLKSCKRSCWMLLELNRGGSINVSLSWTRRGSASKMRSTSSMTSLTRSLSKSKRSWNNIKALASRRLFWVKMPAWMSTGSSKMIQPRYSSK